MKDKFTFDIDFDFRTDSVGADPDSGSLTLASYHSVLWSKQLPSGKQLSFAVTGKPGHYAIRHESGDEVLTWSSDTISNSHKGHLKNFYNQMPPKVNEEHHRGPIGARLVFPAYQIEGKNTINQERGGFNHQLRDRFDLTLECIRLYYDGRKPSPLAETLERYASFFELFGDFRGYVSFFLLEDLVTDDFSAVRLYLPFHDFGDKPLPRAFEDYVVLREAQARFVAERGSRIQNWVLENT